MDDLRGNIFIVKDIDQRCALRHKHHEQCNKAARIGQQQRRGHGSHRCAPDAYTTHHRLKSREIRPLLYNFVDRCRYIHREIHHRSAGADKDTRHENLRQIECFIAAVQETFGERHDRAVDMKRIGAEDAEYGCNGQSRDCANARSKCQAVKAEHQRDDENRKSCGDKRAHEDRVNSVETERNKHFPDG